MWKLLNAVIFVYSK